MNKQSFLKGIPFFIGIICTVVFAAPVSRVTAFSDGSVLFASQLNNEFNNLIGGINSITNDQIASNANISAAKLAANIAGDGIVRDATTGALSVSVDDVGIEISSNDLQLKDAGVANAKLAVMPALSIKGNGTNASAVPTDLAAANDGEVIRRSGTTVAFGQVVAAGIASNAVTTAKILDGNVTKAKLTALGQQTSSSSGSASSYSGTSFQDVTNLSVSITTSGRPVMIMLVSATGANTDAGLIIDDATDNFLRGYFRIDRSGTAVSTQALAANYGDATSDPQTVQAPCSTIAHIDAPAAGTYTYKVQVRGDANTYSVAIDDCKLVAYEL